MSARLEFRQAHTITSKDALASLVSQSGINKELRDAISRRGVELVERIRERDDSGMMELFLSEYGLSTDEGVALMCLAEALLRVPDDETIDALIEDKIAPSEWGKHLGQSHSSLVNASTWALFVTGKVLDDEKSTGMASLLRGAIKRLGEPVIREAVTRLMKVLGQQFVLGETINKAMQRASGQEEKGFTYSYDMLGEAACTRADAQRYFLSYSDAITEIAKRSLSDDIRENPGISIKLSALHPRYETLNKQRVMDELVPRATSLAILAKSAGIGLNIDAEEAGRLDLSLDIIEAVLLNADLKGWDGFGIVVQAYNRRAPFVLKWIYELAERMDRKVMVRLVKGAYWDTEIKHAQVEGHEDFPVYTQKAETDVSYICCAKMLLGMTDRIYPQFATHNAHTVASVLEMADDVSKFEFQRLHGMGEALHDTVLERQSTRCRIYAPVGAHKDLLAYLVRRLLENGANSSFVNQIVDETIPPQEVASDPFDQMDANNQVIVDLPSDLFKPLRINSKGFDLEDPSTLEALDGKINRFKSKTWDVKTGKGEVLTVINPANGNTIGTVQQAIQSDVEKALAKAKTWSKASARERADILRLAADLYEANAGELFALLIREAGKTLNDCVGELREAVDFLRFYADEGEKYPDNPAGIFTCIAPWNFPLAIFTGQVSAALAAGNGVLAKPAETTPLIAALAVKLLHKAGVPKEVLQLMAGEGRIVGSALTSHPKVDGVAFTGSTATAQIINQTMANNLAPSAPLIAETGGLNAMIIDSTALPEQAVRDILASAFQSAGQRCSALRCLYLQQDIAEPFKEMLFGAMDQLRVGNPADFRTDVGPIIDEAAKARIDSHIAMARDTGRLLKQLEAPQEGTFVGPAAIHVNGIEDIGEEVFGPVLHIATYHSDELDDVIDAINSTGYGLTFGFHSRIDDRVQHVIDRVDAGNIYINRNQIGAVVGSQPFGGDGLSGTGPKAGGPKYIRRFMKPEVIQNIVSEADDISLDRIEKAFNSLKVEKRELFLDELPGPTGESNRYSLHPRGRVLCLGPGKEDARLQLEAARKLGCQALAIVKDASDGINGTLSSKILTQIANLEAVVSFGENARELRQALAAREGAIVPLLLEKDFAFWLTREKHVCIDTTAAGGNAALLAGE
jgi:RHH-type proline utilization regulon transcriptional repressor/proline dehydrogenase/delta 1-pyrroline-5-carboxylate dehydrogenase